MRIKDTIEVKSNLIITARERGKIVDRREGHNIWLDLGREYLAQLIAFQSFSPDTPVRDDRIKYMGLGIGGTAQIALPTANSAPISPPYTGTNVQDDVTPIVTTIERPVRISGSDSAYPGIAGDQWVGQIQAPPDLSGGTEVVFRRVFTEEEVSYGPFLIVPISEVMLFTSAADPESFRNTGVAYDTIATLSKTSAVAIEFVWTIRIG
jgi:hypothetical protein